MPELSLIIPVMNEAPNIASLSARIAVALATVDYEVIWVNDGSTDDTSAMIKKYAGAQTRLIELSRNFGQSAALQAGIWESQSDHIATLDGDGQNDPLDILPMFKLIKENGLDMVAGIRADRKDRFLRVLVSMLANSLIRLTTGTHLKDLGCSTRIIKKNCALSLPLRKGMHRYINVILAKQKARLLQVTVNHRPRIAGESKYGWERIFPVIRDLRKLLNHKTISSEPYRECHFQIDSQWSLDQAT